MFLAQFDRRLAALLRGVALFLIISSVASSKHPPAAHGRGLVVGVTLALAVLAWLVWMVMAWRDEWLGLDVFLMAGAGGVLTGACPDSAASAFVFVAIVAAALRRELAEAIPVGLFGAAALAISVAVYHGSGIGLVAYCLGFAAAGLAATTRRQSVVRAEQAELLLAQAQRSHEEQLRAARLAESTRIAREIHDVLAHTLAGLSIQLEATNALLEQGAERAAIAERLRRAHALAREGLVETRRAVGVLRGEPISVLDGLNHLAGDYRAEGEGEVDLRVEGDTSRLSGTTGETVLRVVQEALTNVRKHAPGADVVIRVRAGEEPENEIVATVIDRRPAREGHQPSKTPVRPRESGPSREPSRADLAGSGGGYGLRGMRERAELLGGTLEAGEDDQGWRVTLRLRGTA